MRLFCFGNEGEIVLFWEWGGNYVVLRISRENWFFLYGFSEMFTFDGVATTHSTCGAELNGAKELNGKFPFNGKASYQLVTNRTLSKWNKNSFWNGFKSEFICGHRVEPMKLPRSLLFPPWTPQHAHQWSKYLNGDLLSQFGTPPKITYENNFETSSNRL